MHYDEFIPEFEKQYPEFPWKSVQVSPEQSRRGWGLPSPAGIGRVGVFAPPTETREGDGVSCNPPPTLDLVGVLWRGFGALRGQPDGNRPYLPQKLQT